MYKIVYIPTGNIFELPDSKAENLKEKFPDDYQIIEKNGKAVRKTKKSPKNSSDKLAQNPDSILHKVREED